MKKLKRTAAGLLLAGVMCVQALPMTAWAVDMANSEAVVATDTTPTIVETTTSTATDVRCDIDQTDYFTFKEKDSGVYEVTGTTEAFHQLGNVNITFAENIKSIGKEAFKGTNLKSVEFENDEMYINPEAFCDCAKLTKVSFDKIVAVGDMAFQNCERLTAVNLTNKKLRVIGDGVFAGCDAIEDVVFGVNDYNYHSDSTSSDGFGSGIFTPTGTPYKLTFQMNLSTNNCFTIPTNSFNDGRVKEVCFDGIGKVAVENLAFRNNVQLKSFDFSNVIYIGVAAFLGCSNLQEINLSNKSMQVIGDSAFAGCGNANNIQLSLNDNLQIGKNPFYSASATSNNKPYNLTIYANNENTYEIPESFNFGNKLLTNYEVIGNGELYYGERSFSNCKNLKTAKFGNALGFSDGSFSFCKNLEAANLISAHFFGNDAFSFCGKLSSLKLGVYDESQWNEGAFDFSMTEIVDANGDAISGTMELYMNNEKNVFPLGGTHNISGGGIPIFAEMSFRNMSNLTSVKTYGNGKLELYSVSDNTGFVTRNQFFNCKNLKSFDFSNVTYIGEESFYNCESLTEAKISNSDVPIAEGAFDLCKNLTLYGYTGSTVEAYATANNIPFVALDGGKTTTATSTTGQGSSTTTTTVTTQGSSGTILLGDITLDGRVDISDAVLLNKATAGSVMLNEQAKDNAECYADGNIDANDSTALLQFLVQTIASLPVRE